MAVKKNIDLLRHLVKKNEPQSRIRRALRELYGVSAWNDLKSSQREPFAKAIRTLEKIVNPQVKK